MAQTIASNSLRSPLSRVLLFCPCRQLTTSNTIRFKLCQVARDDGPVKFTKSGAYNLNPLMANMKKREDTPWFQGPLVALSTACFLIYFCYLR